jgi:hypothetical protein
MAAGMEHEGIEENASTTRRHATRAAARAASTTEMGAPLALPMDTGPLLGSLFSFNTPMPITLASLEPKESIVSRAARSKRKCTSADTDANAGDPKQVIKSAMTETLKETGCHMSAMEAVMKPLLETVAGGIIKRVEMANQDIINRVSTMEEALKSLGEENRMMAQGADGASRGRSPLPSAQIGVELAIARQSNRYSERNKQPRKEAAVQGKGLRLRHAPKKLTKTNDQKMTGTRLGIGAQREQAKTIESDIL